MTGDSKQGGSAPQAGEESQPQDGTSSPGQAPGAANGQDPAATAENGTSAASQADGSVDPAEVSRLRREAAGLRTENKRLKDAETAREQAGLSETERLNQRIAALEAENTDLKTKDGQRTVRLAVVEAATRLGFRNPEVAYKLLDTDAVETDDSGAPKNIDRLLAGLAQTDPYLLKPNTAQPDYGGGNRGATPPQQPSMSELLRRASGH